MDQVQDDHSKDFMVLESNGDVIAWSAREHEQQGLGADDKNGIFICLECLRDFDFLKVALFVGEEVGCKGSGACDLTFFKDCRFIIEPDRKGFNDLITSMCCGDVCSEEFIKAIEPYNPGYEEARGTVTDVGELVERGVGISCINISCGYYDAHTDHEYTVLDELEMTLEFVQDIIENVGETFPFEYDYKSYGYYDDYGYNYGYSYFGGKKKSEDKTSGTRTYMDPSYEYWQNYDDDFDEMYNILSGQPYLTFEEVLADWHMNFFTKDSDLLRDIYEDALYSLDCKMGDDDETFMNGEYEDEDEGEITLELDEPNEETTPEEDVEETKDEKSGLQVILNSFKGFCKKVS